MSTTATPAQTPEKVDNEREEAVPGGTLVQAVLGPVARWFTTRNVLITGAQIATMVILILAWDLFAGPPGGRWTLVDQFYVGQPGEAWQAIKDWTADGTLKTHAIVTLRETIYGFVIGCVSGVAIGFLLAVNAHVGRVFYPLVMAANTVPKLALAPMLIMWFGIGEPSKIATAALLVFFLVFINTFQGVREVDQQLVNALKVIGAGRATILRRVTVPSSLVWVVTGMRTSVPYAFLGAVVGEMMAAQNGLGTLIQRSSNAFQPSMMMAAIIVLIAFALLLNAVIGILERIVLRWKYLK